MSTETMNAVALLSAPRSPERRKAARRLRKLKDPAACPALLDALQQEVQDPRTWETQYQLVMALGESGCAAALAYLDQLARQPFDATMVYTALGDAIVRLARRHEQDPAPVLTLMQTGNDMLIDGAFRAVAMLRLKLEAAAVDQIVDYAAARGPHDPLRFWVAAAAAGWHGPNVERFLTACASGPRDDVREAAEASLHKRYRSWHPL